MKLVQITLAFASIYLFLSSVVFTLLFCVWLGGFHADMSQRPFAQVTENGAQDNRITLVYKENTKDSSFMDMARIKSEEEDFQTISLEEQIPSSSFFLQYKKGVVSSALVPLGFTTLYKLEKVTDAEGKVLYIKKDSIVESLYQKLFGKNIGWTTETLSVVATDEVKTYTITATAEGVKLHEN